MNTDIKLEHSFIFDLHKLADNDKKLEMIWVAPGTFTMGSEESSSHSPDEAPFEATLTDGFWLSRYPITVAQWHIGLGLDEELTTINSVNRNLPQSANWYESNMYCWELNRRLSWNFENRYIMKEHHYRFMLPVEAQWEYACRAGTDRLYYNSNNLDDLDKAAWYIENSGGKLHPVGEKIPNQWGFYDMLGNVSEWCADTYTQYPKKRAVNWVGKSKAYAPEYVVRGGNVEDTAVYLRCTSRNYQQPFTFVQVYGFRICLTNIEYEPIFY